MISTRLLASFHPHLANFHIPSNQPSSNTRHGGKGHGHHRHRHLRRKEVSNSRYFTELFRKYDVIPAATTVPSLAGASFDMQRGNSVLQRTEWFEYPNIRQATSKDARNRLVMHCSSTSLKLPGWTVIEDLLGR
jgi:hypothetical protein